MNFYIQFQQKGIAGFDGVPKCGVEENGGTEE
jgi:hypothetical protein